MRLATRRRLRPWSKVYLTSRAYRCAVSRNVDARERYVRIGCQQAESLIENRGDRAPEFPAGWTHFPQSPRAALVRRSGRAFATAATGAVIAGPDGFLVTTAAKRPHRGRFNPGTGSPLTGTAVAQPAVPSIRRIPTSSLWQRGTRLWVRSIIRTPQAQRPTRRPAQTHGPAGVAILPRRPPRAGGGSARRVGGSVDRPRW